MFRSEMQAEISSLTEQLNYQKSLRKAAEDAAEEIRVEFEKYKKNEREYKWHLIVEISRSADGKF